MQLLLGLTIIAAIAKDAEEEEEKWTEERGLDGSDLKIWIPYEYSCMLTPYDLDHLEVRYTWVNPMDPRIPGGAPYSRSVALEYAQRMRDGDPNDIPPIILVERYTDERFHHELEEPIIEVLDGEHRIYAARRAGLERIPAVVATQRNYPKMLTSSD